MRERVTITKEWLEKNGVTNVSRDGTVYKWGEIASVNIASCPHKVSGRTKSYPTVLIFDSERYQILKQELNPLDASHKAMRGYMVSRIVYAWYYGTCPAELDVDHIDNDPFNNSIDNLQLLTRKDNLSRRKSRNQYTCHLTDEEIDKHIKENKRLTEEVDKARALYLKAKAELENKRDLYKKALEDCKNPENYPDCIIYKDIYRKKFKKAQKLYNKARNRWHFWADSKHQFLKKRV